jgi:hypothetical protein
VRAVAACNYSIRVGCDSKLAHSVSDEGESADPSHLTTAEYPSGHAVRRFDDCDMSCYSYFVQCKELVVIC